jgi:hypothetical protein
MSFFVIFCHFIPIDPQSQISCRAMSKNHPTPSLLLRLGEPPMMMMSKLPVNAPNSSPSIGGEGSQRQMQSSTFNKLSTLLLQSDRPSPLVSMNGKPLPSTLTCWTKSTLPELRQPIEERPVRLGNRLLMSPLYSEETSLRTATSMGELPSQKVYHEESSGETPKTKMRTIQSANREALNTISNPDIFVVATPIYVDRFESLLVDHPQPFVQSVYQGLRELSRIPTTGSGLKPGTSRIIPLKHNLSAITSLPGRQRG